VVAGFFAFGRAVRRRWRQSFVLSVTLVALVGVAVFALVISRVVRGEIEDQALDRARDTTAIVARSSFAPRLPGTGQRLAAVDVTELDRQLAAARASEPAIRMRLWARDGNIVYAGDHQQIGQRPPQPRAVSEALGGRPATDVKRDGPGDTSPGASLTSAVPVRRTKSGPIEAALEVARPYAPVGQDIRDRTRRLELALLVAALIAYALALPALIRAGRAVRAQYDPRRVRLMRDLRRAMKNGELALYFQPIADATTGEVQTAEALLRWNDPGRGIVGPDKFIPLIETTELMWPLTVHIFGLVARQEREWEQAGVGVRIAVNVSSADIIDPRLPGELDRLLTEYGVRPRMLEIEVTEGALMEDPIEATRVLEEITALGFGVVAIDDFGTGYSSLARLHELPLDELKIDQSFVMRMAREGDHTVVRSVIELAHALGLKVIAEGVESEETWRDLTEMGCDFIQGYVLTRPLAPRDFEDWLRDSRTERGLSPAAPR
jgi:EAL domain-containing protein (putative c-di-GMP-specific phosphodiesterase class I)